MLNVNYVLNNLTHEEVANLLRQNYDYFITCKKYLIEEGYQVLYYTTESSGSISYSLTKQKLVDCGKDIQIQKTTVTKL